MRVDSHRVLFYVGRAALLFIPIALIVALLGVLTLPAGASSSLITVTTTDDELNADGDCSLREAIEAANTNMAVDNCPAGNPGADTILLSNTTYDLSLGAGDENDNQQDDFDILDTLIISGTGATIDASVSSRIFHVDPYATGVNFTLVDITLTNGFRPDGGGIYVRQGRVYLDNTTIVNNQASSEGGGIYIDTGYLYLVNSSVMTNTAGDGGGIYSQQGVVHMLNSTVEYNATDDDDGGGIYARGGAIHMDNSRVRANYANRYGGGIYLYHGLLEMENGSDVSNNVSNSEGGGIYTYGGGSFINDSTINNNMSIFYGGGIAVSEGGPGGIVIVNSLIDGNSTEGHGGGVYGDEYAGVVITNSVISNNYANDDGGGLMFERSASLYLYGSQVLSNTATNGGGIQMINNSTLHLTHSEIAYNLSDSGGGVYINASTGLLIEDSYVHDNSAVVEGGGMYLSGNLSGVIEDSTFSENGAGFGGGVFFLGANKAFEFTNVTLSSNTAITEGGAIYAQSVVTSLTLNYVTLVNNTAVTGGAISANNGTYVTAHNSLILGNGGAGDCAGDFNLYMSLGFNLVDGDGDCPFDDVSDRMEAGANLFTTVVGSLADNGGFAPSHAPLSGSPVIDGSLSPTCPAGDQAGNTRPQGNACDIGSVESAESATVPTFPTNVITVNTMDDELNADGDCSLREAVEAANTNVAVDNCPAGATPDSATDIILLSANTYNLTIPGAGEDNNQTGDLDIIESVTLVGQGSDLTTITTIVSDRLIEASSGTTAGVVLTIADLTLTGGNAPTDGGGLNVPTGALLIQDAEIRANTTSSQRGGGIYMSLGAMYLIDTLVTENFASDEGGGMYSQHGTVNLKATDVMSNSANTDGAGLATLVGSVLLDSSDFISNTALDDGGAVKTTFGLVVMRNTTLADNYADQSGGGVYSELGGIVVDDSAITGNTAFDDDGGGLNTNFGGVVMHNSVVSNNLADSDGGGIYQFAGLGVYINSEISDNQASNEGGGLHYYYGMGYLRNMLFDNNSAIDGGGLYTGEAATDIRYSVFRDNTAVSGGGIHYYFYGSHILADSVVEENTALNGGGLFTSDEPTLFLERVTIANNIAVDDGGGIHGELYVTSLIELLNVTLSGNDALRGGAIYTQNPLYINYSTLVDNGAVTDGGGLYLDDDPAVIQNSIIGGNRVNGDNSAATANCFYGNSAPTSNGHNVFSDAACNPTAGDTMVPADDIIGLVVDVLADNGGAILPGGITFDTHALVNLSVAMDAGEGLLCPATDARGNVRPMNVLCDIGAYEAEVFELTVALGGNGSGTVTGDGINCGSDCTESYFENSVVNLTPSADLGSTFTGWSGDCGGTGACIVTMSEARNVTANFVLEQFALTVSVTGTGEGSVLSDPAGIDCPSDCNETYNYNTPVTLTANPATGSTFTGWSGACSGTGACIVTMSEARNVTANFVLEQFALTVSVTGTGEGSVLSDPAGIDCPSDCNETYNYNTPVTLTANPATGSTFTGWSGACSGTGSCVVTMSEARTVTANFTLNQYALTVTVVGEGTVMSDPAGINCPSDCNETYDYNTPVTLTANAADGSTFTGWSGACSGTGDCLVTLSEAQNVTATFTQDSFELYLPIITN